MTFQFKIQIKGITKPTVWRRILVNSKTSFRDFHEIIQNAFGWTFSHLYLFSEKGFQSPAQIQDPEFSDEEYSESTESDRVALQDIFKKAQQTYTYIYDFGDSWEHKIILEKITDEKIKHPSCIAGEGQCPPEDCGGIWGFSEFKEAVNNPEHPEYEDYREWFGLNEEDYWGPKEFDLEEVNKELREM